MLHCFYTDHNSLHLFVQKQSNMTYHMSKLVNGKCLSAI